jgi:hypothetical protein
LSQIKELETEPQPGTLEKTPLVSSLLRRTPRTVPQFAQGSKFTLELIEKGTDSMVREGKLILSQVADVKDKGKRLIKSVYGFCCC